MPENITLDDARYALDFVKKICDEVGPGAPGTPQERQRAAMIRKELEAHLGAGGVVEEEFTAATDAFLGSLPLSGLLLLVAALLNISTRYTSGALTWVAAAVALVCAVLAPLPYIFEYQKFQEFIDPLFKKRSSVNVIGTLRRPGTTRVKRLLMVSGHHDSALENTWIGLLGYGFLVTIPVLMIGYLTLIVVSILLLGGMMIGNQDLIHAGTLGWVPLVFPILPAVIFALFFNRGRKGGGTVPGAADNLAACAVAVTLCRTLAKNPQLIPADTEIRFITFGCEEAGLRGSRRYVARHLDELKRLDARLLNYEVIAHPEIIITIDDVNGVKNDPEMVQSLAAAAERAGVPHRVAPYPMGGGASDAGYFSQAGIKAATLIPCKFPQQIVAFYHQKKDTPDVLTIDILLNVLKLTFEWARAGGQ